MTLQLLPDNQPHHQNISTTATTPVPLLNSPITPAGIAVRVRSHPDHSLTCPFISRTCQDFLGITAAAIQADFNALLSLIYPSDRPSFHATRHAAIECPQPWLWEGRLLLPQGSTVWVQWYCEAESSDTGIQWQGFLVDITHQHQTNAQLERLSFLLGLTERIQISTNLYEISRFALHYLVQATNCAFGDIKVVNKVDDSYEAQAIQNYVSGEFVATYGEPAVAEMAEALKYGQPYGQGLLWEVVETGEPLYIEDYANHPRANPAFRNPAIGQLAIFPIPALDGTILGVLTLEARNLQRIQELPQQDMLLAACRIMGARIEWAQAQERLRQQAEQLAQTVQELQQTQMQLVQTEKMSSLGQLVAGIAHEINNPINFIYGNLTYAANYTEDLLNLLQIYQRSYPQPAPEVEAAAKNIDLEFVLEDYPKILASMRLGAERVRQIVLSLRNFSRLDEADMKRIDLHEGLDSTLMLLQHRLKERSNSAAIRITKDYGDLPPVQCYVGQLNQVFMNVLSNAIDALEEGITAPEIQIQTRLNADNCVEICIRDNGTGMPETVRQRLFDPFFTTKPVGKGTGLGLAISYQIVVEKHRGQLLCDSNPGAGTEFLIQIPVEQQAKD